MDVNPEDTELQPDPPPAAGDVEPAGTDAEPVPSLRETIEAAARDAGGETNETADSTGRRHGPDGKFLPKAGALGDNGGEIAATPGRPASPSPAVTSDTPAAPSTAPAGPPPGWASEAKAVFPTLPPAVQQAVIKREQEVSAGFAQYAQAKQQLEQVIAPRRQYYAGDGVSDVQAIDNIWKWFEALKNSPHEAMPALAQVFGYDLSTVTPGASDDSSQVNPEVAALRAEVARLNGTVGQVTTTFEQQQTAARRAELASFAKDKPHFEKVRVTMGRLMAAGVAGNLDDAYQQAVKVTPDVAALVAADEKAAADKAAAEAALRGRPGSQRRAAVSVRGGSPNGAAGPAMPTSIRESLKQGFAEARGG